MTEEVGGGFWEKRPLWGGKMGGRLLVGGISAHPEGEFDIALQAMDHKKGGWEKR